jgi:NitT/TauT family transport system substrate-binding protein
LRNGSDILILLAAGGRRTIMMHRTRTFAALLAASIALASGAPLRAQTVAPPLRIATIPLENSAQVFYAKDMGFFAKAGLDVDLQSLQSGSAVAGAVASGAVDIGFSSLVPLAVAHIKNVPFVIVAPGVVWTDAGRNNGLFVKDDSPIHSAADLNGKVLATAGLGTLTEFAPRAWVQQHGGDPATIKFVEMPYSVMPAALAAGRVDAALVNEPYLGAVRKGNRLLGYPYDAVANEFLIAAWFSTAQWAKEHPDLVARFASVMRDTAVWANKKENRAKAAEILAKYTKIDPASLANIVHVRFTDQLTAALVQPQIDVTAKYSGFPTFPARDLMIANPK